MLLTAHVTTVSTHRQLDLQAAENILHKHAPAFRAAPEQYHGHVT